MVTTDFSTLAHGFRFANAFDFSAAFELPVVGPIDLGRLVYGLCGGMCFAALDYFNAGRPLPTNSSVEELDPALYRHLWKRQMDSLSLPLGVLKVVEWTLRSDENVGRLTAGGELGKLRRRLDKGAPAVLVLLRTRGLGDLTRNHQVVAHGYDLDEATNQVTIHVYDPNHPGREPQLTMSVTKRQAGINPAQSTGEPLRGFFVVDYKPQPPP